MDRTQYSMAADSRRWWWPAAAVGTVALVATMAIPAAVLASPVDRPAAPTGVDLVTDVVTTVDTGGWPCFMGRADWNTAAYGPRPRCGTTAGPRPVARVDCPPTPDVRFIGVPWVPPKRTGCESLDHWWEAIDR